MLKKAEFSSSLLNLNEFASYFHSEWQKEIQLFILRLVLTNLGNLESHTLKDFEKWIFILFLYLYGFNFYMHNLSKSWNTLFCTWLTAVERKWKTGSEIWLFDNTTCSSEVKFLFSHLTNLFNSSFWTLMLIIVTEFSVV